ncbi:MAG: hypothetical protein MUO21_01370, partial [Nitrososphaeraceae archaeon]|nr:hypothetical protein [Nitrososphaeraceae archaeon]
KKAPSRKPSECEELDRLSFLQSRSDPGQEYYCSEKEEICSDCLFTYNPYMPTDRDEEFAWRHATYNPPKKFD